MKKEELISILIRYSVLFILAIFGAQVFHFLFLQLTLYPLYFIFQIFFDVSLLANTIFVQGFPIEIISACVAGSAYLLLLILNLSTPKINFTKRILMIAFSFFSFLLINILRIFFLSFLLISGNSLFDFTHKLFWYLGSTLFVVGIWFLTVKIFKIEEVPFYSDIKGLYLLMKKSHKSKSSKKH